MKESVTYQAIVEEGVAKGVAQGRLERAKHSLLLLGETLHGTPAGPGERASIEAIDSLQQLHALTRRAPRVRSWAELLASPPAPKRRGRKKGRP